jgi:hypothetical protein
MLIYPFGKGIMFGVKGSYWSMWGFVTSPRAKVGQQFYVAITRPQNRLWIFESNEIKLAPVVRLLAAQKEPLVEMAYVNDRDVGFLAPPR